MEVLKFVVVMPDVFTPEIKVFGYILLSTQFFVVSLIVYFVCYGFDDDESEDEKSDRGGSVSEEEEQFLDQSEFEEGVEGRSEVEMTRRRFVKPTPQKTSAQESLISRR
jgi:hypothetical protein